METMIRRDPITGIYEVVPAPGEVEEMEEAEETVQMPDPVVESVVITEPTKKRGRPPK